MLNESLIELRESQKELTKVIQEASLQIKKVEDILQETNLNIPVLCEKPIYIELNGKEIAVKLGWGPNNTQKGTYRLMAYINLPENASPFFDDIPGVVKKPAEETKALIRCAIAPHLEDLIKSVTEEFRARRLELLSIVNELPSDDNYLDF